MMFFTFPSRTILKEKINKCPKLGKIGQDFCPNTLFYRSEWTKKIVRPTIGKACSVPNKRGLPYGCLS